MQAIINEWRRLILPPDPFAPAAAEQREDGGGWDEVPAAQVLLKKHLAGIATYAVALGWPDHAGPLARAGVIEVTQEGDAAQATMQALHAAAEAAGLTALSAWSGGAGRHLWIFAEPVPVAAMTAALRRLKAAVPQAGAAVPGDGARVTLVPGWQRAGGGWSYFHRADETPTPADSEVVPEGLMDHQQEVLGSIRPTPAAVLLAFAGQAAPAPASVPAVEPASGRLALTLSPDGRLLRLVVTGADGAAVAADLGADEALALASDLIEGARRRLLLKP